MLQRILDGSIWFEIVTLKRSKVAVKACGVHNLLIWLWFLKDLYKTLIQRLRWCCKEFLMHVIGRSLVIFAFNISKSGGKSMWCSWFVMWWCGYKLQIAEEFIIKLTGNAWKMLQRIIWWIWLVKSLCNSCHSMSQWMLFVLGEVKKKIFGSRCPISRQNCMFSFVSVNNHFFLSFSLSLSLIGWWLIFWSIARLLQFMHEWVYWNIRCLALFT